MLVAPLIESLILADRLIFLREQTSKVWCPQSHTCYDWPHPHTTRTLTHDYTELFFYSFKIWVCGRRRSRSPDRRSEHEHCTVIRPPGVTAKPRLGVHVLRHLLCSYWYWYDIIWESFLEYKWFSCVCFDDIQYNIFFLTHSVCSTNTHISYLQTCTKFGVSVKTDPLLYTDT